MTKPIEEAVTASAAMGSPAGQKDGSARRWFPVRGDMMQRQEFVRLSVCQKLVLLDINYRLHEHLSLLRREWRRGPFVEADLKWAKRLNMSVEAFRCARRKLGKLRWVILTSGYRTREGELRRTQYHEAQYAEVVKGIQSGAMYRRIWQDLLVAMKKGRLRHRDLVVLAYLCFFWKILGGREMGCITIPKAKIGSMARMPAATFKASLEQLAMAELSGDFGSIPLFQFREKHRYGFEISNWWGGPDVALVGVPSRPSTLGFVPVTAILTHGVESESDKTSVASGAVSHSEKRGDRGSKSLGVQLVDRRGNDTHATAKLEGGRGSNEFQR
jgi:hypothetical protein